ncbi:hypothetical protein PLEOSDRAFT_1114683 [Pleurotus ostreatus PC15]|uniref:Uncharacterized protein n=1 Tax=Pleurotus ostreatus (strain PC15) TaxID=1137138 RepID=A0A067N409_PLEO1|nr:hypothetical protein PLEOSDRAFT_1114683 [Pleurotus ostreatus PC15]
MGKKDTRKTASSSNPQPTSTPVAGEKPKKLTARELLLKAFDALPVLDNLRAKASGSKDAEMLAYIERYITTQKEADKASSPFGFSSVKGPMLEELGIRQAEFNFDLETLQTIASSRGISVRFDEDLRYLKMSGLSTKEQLSSIMTVNYLRESMYNAPPQLAIPPGTHVNEDNGMQYPFHGAADYLVFLVDKDCILQGVDIDTLLKLKRYSNRSLVIVEVKNPANVFTPGHIAEAVAQVATASLHTGRDHHFIMTDSQEWRFCIYRQEEKIYYMSHSLSVLTHGNKAILTALDEWVWDANLVNSPHQLWNYRTTSKDQVLGT